MAKSNEPIWWSLFSAGGVVAAFIFPVAIVVTAIAVPAGWIAAENLRELYVHPLARLFLFVVISLAFYHWAHRFRYVAVDLGLRGLGGLLAFVCYGAAVVGMIFAAVTLVSI